MGILVTPHHSTGATSGPPVVLLAWRWAIWGLSPPPACLPLTRMMAHLYTGFPKNPLLAPAAFQGIHAGELRASSFDDSGAQWLISRLQIVF